jgi:hypothetical protein
LIGDGGMMKAIWGMLALCAVAGVFAQDAGENPKLTRKAVPESTAKMVLTQGELVFNVNRLEKVLRRVAGLSAAKPIPAPAQPDAPATRTQVISQLHRLFEDSSAKFKYTPRMINFQPEVFTLPAGSAPRKQAEKLVRWGFMNRVSPVLTGKSESVSLKDFGETMGLFVIRSSDLLHVPSSKFSPYLMPGG